MIPFSNAPSLTWSNEHMACPAGNPAASPASRTGTIEDIAKAADEIEGISSFKEIRVHNAGNDLIASIKIILEPDLKIRDGYQKVEALREKLTAIDGIIDVIINVDLKEKGA